MVLGDLTVGLAGSVSRLVRQHRDEGVDLLVVSSDRVETLLDELLGARTSIADVNCKSVD